MGYSANNIHGDSILIPMEKARDFVELLRESEKRFGHISWCDTVETYEARLDNKYPNIVEAMMTDYGFLVTWSDDSNSVVLYSWGGDKIGSSWDDVWNALAKVVSNEVTWIMVGEDQHIWAERLANGERKAFSIDFDKLIPWALTNLS